MMHYPIELTPDDNDTLLVSCPDLPEVVSFGHDEADAELHAADAIAEALAARMQSGADIPAPHQGLIAGPAARISALRGMKIELYRGLRQNGMTRAELARRLDWNRESVDRLFRLDHRSRVEQIESALHVLGLRLGVRVQAEAAA